MQLQKVINLLNANCLTKHNINNFELSSAFGCDLMSDVLAFVDDETLLLTGLVNAQVVRTAEMLDIHSIVFVRGKIPDDPIIQLANEKGINLLTTEFTMYNSCGILYTNGLNGVDIKGEDI